MAEENIKEICRSLSMGMTAEEVAKIEEIPVSDVEDIQCKFSADIEERKKFRNEAYYSSAG